MASQILPIRKQQTTGPATAYAVTFEVCGNRLPYESWLAVLYLIVIWCILDLELMGNESL